MRTSARLGEGRFSFGCAVPSAASSKLQAVGNFTNRMGRGPGPRLALSSCESSLALRKPLTVPILGTISTPATPTPCLVPLNRAQETLGNLPRK